MTHAFTDSGGIVCGLLFPSLQRISGPQDMPTCDRVTNVLEHVDCLRCREKLGVCVHGSKPADCNLCVNTLRYE